MVEVPTSRSSRQRHVNSPCVPVALQAFSTMTALRDLYIEQNLLVELPPSITKLSTLVMLRLSANRLRRLPDVSILVKTKHTHADAIHM